MYKIFAITVAYSPAALLARSLILYQKTRFHTPFKHVVVQGHYPINEKKNTNDIKLITECFPEIELLDPGKNLGSAQSQNWALERIGISDEDYFINLDPDSACLIRDWDFAMQMVLDYDPNCVLISCLAPMVERYMNGTAFAKIKTIKFGYRYAIPTRPTPFNLSMWRYSFIKQIGGIPQAGLFWGETEGPFYSACQRLGKYHAYLTDYLEDENGKFMQDKEHNDYKNLHMRTPPPNQFLGSFDEYLRWKHPALTAIDTCKNLDDHNHP